MISQLTIPKQKEQPLAINRQQLFEIGLKYVQQLSSRIWTDYNVHDPGITTLELLCYALTDLSYRASLPIEDLLASENANSENMKKQFFTARQILPNRALTELDYRKLLIDLPGVKNAWLEQAIQGYYADPAKGELLGTPTLFAEEIINLPLLVTRLKQEPPDSVSRYLLAQLRDVTREALVTYEGGDSEAELLQTLLVQDINHIIQGDCFYQEGWLSEFTISQQTQSLIERYQQAKVKKRSTEDICDRLNRLLLEDIYPESIAHYHLLIKKIIDLPSFTAKLKQESPDPVSRYLFEQLRDDTRQELAAYEDADSPAQRLHTLLVEDLNRIIQGESIYEEQRFSEFALILSPATLGLIALQQQLNGNNLSSKKISDRLNRLLLNDVYPQEIARYHPLRTTATLRSIKKVSLAGLYDVIIDYMDDTDDKDKVMQDVKQRLYSNRNLCEDFVSFRGVETQSFLLCAELELAPDADASRVKAEIFFQVQQYLAPPINNYSLSEMLERTKADGTPYTADEIFEGPLLDCGFIDDDELRKADLRTKIRLSDLISIIMDIVGVQAVRDIVINPAPTAPDSPLQPLDNKWVVSVDPGKKALLSQERSLAYNYSLENEGDLWDTGNVSGLEKRLAKLLGIRNHKRRNLSDIDYDYTEIAETSDDQYLFRIQKGDTSEIILSSSTNYPDREAAQVAMERAIHLALLPSGYERKVATNNKHYFNIIEDNGEVVAQSREYDTEAQMNQAIDEVIEYLHVNYSKEGMYLIENILLRPEENGDPLLPICPDPNCLDCADVDPYSYRIHIILPAYSSRFSDMDFRRFAEAVIREETPAHILPKICWINEDDMAELETLYRDWIYLKAGVEKEDRRNKLKNFIDKLYKVKSVYPQQKIRECDSEEGEDKFILGRSVLGSNGTIET